MPRKRKGALPSGNVRVQVFVGIRADGTRRYESFTAKTKVEAQAAAAAFRIRAARLKAAGIPVDDIPRDDAPPMSKDTVGRALDLYLDTCRATGLAPDTVLEYKRTIARAYAPLKRIPVGALSVQDLQGYVNTRAQEGASPKTIRNEIGILTAALSAARPDLSARLLRLPRQTRREMRIPTTQEVQRMFDAARGTPLYLPLLLAALMGLRRSEICALRWADVDLRKRTLHVCAALVVGEDGYAVKAPKTAAGDRVLPIPAAMIPALKAARALDPRVTQLTPFALSRRYEAMRDAIGMTYRFHDLRHYHASMMIAVGAPDKYITADMGHASMDMVRRVYGHVMADRQREINEQMDAQAAAFSL